MRRKQTTYFHCFVVVVLFVFCRNTQTGYKSSHCFLCNHQGKLLTSGCLAGFFFSPLSYKQLVPLSEACWRNLLCWLEWCRLFGIEFGDPIERRSMKQMSKLSHSLMIFVPVGVQQWLISSCMGSFGAKASRDVPESQLNARRVANLQEKNEFRK